MLMPLGLTSQIRCPNSARYGQFELQPFSACKIPTSSHRALPLNQIPLITWKCLVVDANLVQKSSEGVDEIVWSVIFAVGNTDQCSLQELQAVWRLLAVALPVSLRRFLANVQ